MISPDRASSHLRRLKLPRDYSRLDVRPLIISRILFVFAKKEPMPINYLGNVCSSYVERIKISAVDKG